MMSETMTQPHPASDDADPGIMSKRQINSQLPVNRLPPEILGEIFAVWVLQYRKSDERWIHWNWNWSRKKLSHVCHLWREVALGLPCLWGEFRVTCRDSTAAMLSRSQGTPLDVRIYSSGEHREPIQLVLDQLHRIRTLDYTAPTTESQSYAFGGTAPILHSLRYEANQIYKRVPNSVALHADATTIPEWTPFEDINMPALRALTLKDSGISWSSPLLKSTLTHLSITSFRHASIYWNREDILAVIQVLASMPMLEELLLHNVLPVTCPDNVPAPSSAVTHPRLQKLDVWGTSARSAAYLLHALAYPATARVCISCFDTGGDATLGALLHAAAARAAADTWPFRAVSVSGGGLRAWAADPGPAVLSTSVHVPRPPPALSVAHDCRVLDAYFAHLARAVPPRAAGALYFAPPWRDGEGTCLFADDAPWTDACARMVSVRVVGVGRHGLPEVCALMRADVRDGRLGRRGGGGTAPVFPVLQTLVLRCVWVRHCPRPARPSTLLRGLRAVLRARAAAGYRLARLVLLSCINIVPADVDFLRDAADTVEWDGEQYAAQKGTTAFSRTDGDVELDPRTSSALGADAGAGPESSDSDGDDDDGVDGDDASNRPGNEDDD